MRNRIRHYRKHIGITQQELALRIGVSRQTINIIEKGTQNPSLELAFRIARAMHTTIEDLFEYKEHEPLYRSYHYIG